MLLNYYTLLLSLLEIGTTGASIQIWNTNKHYSKENKHMEGEKHNISKIG